VESVKQKRSVGSMHNFKNKAVQRTHYKKGIILYVVDASLNAASRGCLLSGGRGDAVESP